MTPHPTFRKVLISQESNPKESGWYDTDLGKLPFGKSNKWYGSYPTCYYLPVAAAEEIKELPTDEEIEKECSIRGIKGAYGEGKIVGMTKMRDIAAKIIGSKNDEIEKEALKFKYWCDSGNAYLFDNQEQYVHSNKELYNIYKQQQTGK